MRIEPLIQEKGRWGASKEDLVADLRVGVISSTNPTIHKERENSLWLSKVDLFVGSVRGTTSDHVT